MTRDLATPRHDWTLEEVEALFEQPLAAVRTRLGLRPPTVYEAVPDAVRKRLKLRA